MAAFLSKHCPQSKMHLSHRASVMLTHRRLVNLITSSPNSARFTWKIALGRPQLIHYWNANMCLFLLKFNQELRLKITCNHFHSACNDDARAVIQWFKLQNSGKLHFRNITGFRNNVQIICILSCCFSFENRIKLLTELVSNHVT